MRNRLWRRYQRERIIQKVICRIKNKTNWLYSGTMPVPHLYWLREDYINRYPALDHWIPPRTWEEVFLQRRKEALFYYKAYNDNPRKWYKEITLQEKKAKLNELEQREELYVEPLAIKY